MKPLLLVPLTLLFLCRFSSAQEVCREEPEIGITFSQSYIDTTCKQATFEAVDQHFRQIKEQNDSSTVFRRIRIVGSTFKKLKFPNSMANKHVRGIFLRNVGTFDLDEDFRVDFLESLRYLDLSNNSIRSLKNWKSCLGHQESAQVLVMGTTLKVADFDLSRCTIKEGQFLLANNRIKRVDLGLFPKGLSNIDLSHNRIEFVTFGDTDAEFVDLRQNQLTVLGPISPKLIKLSVERNEISRIVPNNTTSSLKELNLERNLLETIKSEDFPYLPNLEVLNLKNNNLTDIEEGAFSSLGQLKELDLGQNQLRELRKGVFKDLHSLEKLKIWGNHLARINDEEEFYRLTKLKELVITEDVKRLAKVDDIGKYAPNVKVKIYVIIDYER